MKAEFFIDGIKLKRDFTKEAIKRLLQSPPGRRPKRKDLMLSEFYNTLDEAQKEKVDLIIEESIDMGIFSFFCVLDHVSFLEDTPEKTQFELYAVKDGERVLLNDFSQELLHDLYNGLVQE